MISMRHEITFISAARAYALVILTIGLSISVAVPTAAAEQNTAGATARTASNSRTKSDWSSLTAAQQQALAPLAADWNSLDSAHKNKWLAIGNKFPAMQPEERSRIQNRMREWVKLSPQQRRIARENYWRAKKIDPSQKSAHWQEYQQLPDEQKKSLAATGIDKKRGASLSKARKNSDVFPVRPKKILTQPSQTQDKNSSILTPSVQSDTK